VRDQKNYIQLKGIKLAANQGGEDTKIELVTTALFFFAALLAVLGCRWLADSTT